LHGRTAKQRGVVAAFLHAFDDAASPGAVQADFTDVDDELTLHGFRIVDA
jgi:hypothetical protein